MASIYHHVEPYEAIVQASTGRAEHRSGRFEPVRIAILDSGYDPSNSLLFNADRQLDPRIKDARNFVHGTEVGDVQDELGHGTHALGILLKVATCAEIYIARVANRMTLGRESYDAIAKVRRVPNQNNQRFC